MYGYGQQGPAQWAGQQQRQQHNSMQNLMNVLMQVKMMKHREDTREQEREEVMAFREQQLASLNRHRRARESEWAKPNVPKIPEKVRAAELLIKWGPETPQGKALRKAYKIKTPEDEAKAMEIFQEKEKIKAGLRPDPGAGGAAGRAATQSRWETTRADNIIKSGTVTTTSKFSKRGSIVKDVDDTWIEIQNTNADAFHDPQIVDDYRKRAGVHLDMPRKYTKTIKLMEMDLATPAEQQYYIDAAETKETLDGFPEIMSIADMTPALRAEVNLAIAKEILALRKAKGKNIFQKARDIF